MGHAISVLTFPCSDSIDSIQKACDEWGEYNCDPRERGGFGRGLGHSIRFKSELTFDSYHKAYDWLMNHCGNYENYAVRYYKYPKLEETKKMADIKRRIVEVKARIAALEEPHFKGVKQSTVKCKKCGSSLATKYCGESYRNNCPICHSDLRPMTTLKQLAKAIALRDELDEKLLSENDKQNKKNIANAELHWAVCCEVHC